jgi:TP901-1 family phage major tail protein
MAISGRSLRISRDGTTIAGARTDNFTINAEPIDVTDKDDAGWRTLLADVGTRSVSADVEGVLKDATLIAAATGTASLLLEECVITVTGIGTLTGDFMLSSLQLGAEMADAVTFTATLESGESMTVTIGPYNTVAPAVTGTPTVGQTLTTTNGTWAGDATITFARQWQAGNVADPNDPSWANISGATNLTYVLASGQLAKRVRCRVTATNSVGSTIAYSNVVGPVA